MDRLIFLVRRDRRDLHEALTRAFAGERQVEVIMDRRFGGRRKRDLPSPLERRRFDRRAYLSADAELRERGWSVVRLRGESREA